MVYLQSESRRRQEVDKGSWRPPARGSPSLKARGVASEIRGHFLFGKEGKDLVTREKKAKVLEHLQEVLPKSSLILLTDYKGLTVAQMKLLRDKLREKFQDGAKYMVVKNTLLRISLENIGYDPKELGNALEGPTAILYATEADPIEALKTLYDTVKENKWESFKFKGGYLEGKVFTSEEVEKLAKLPSKQELYAMLVSTVQGPIRGFAYVLSGLLRNLVYALNQIKEKKSE